MRIKLSKEEHAKGKKKRIVGKKVKTVEEIIDNNYRQSTRKEDNSDEPESEADSDGRPSPP